MTRVYFHRVKLWAFCVALLLLGQQVLATPLDDARLSLRTRQYATAVKQLQPLAQAQDAEAQYLLASLYRRGLGVERDLTQARALLIQAADLGHSQAAYDVAIMLEKGQGGAQDLRAAKQRYQQVVKTLPAAEQALTRLQAVQEEPCQDRLYRLINLQQTAELMSCLQQTPKLLNQADASQGGHTPLTYAIERGKQGSVTALLKAGANPQAPGAQSLPPLAIAVQQHDEALVKALLTAKADVKWRDPQGNSLLHWAVRKKSRAIIDLLLRVPVDVNAKNLAAETPLDILDEGESNIRQRLLVAGAASGIAAVKAQTNDHKAVAQHILATGDNDQNALFAGWPPLNVAAWRGQVDLVDNLILLGADVNSLDEGGMTPLARAVAQGHEAVVERLLNAKAAVNLPAASSDKPVSEKQSVFEKQPIVEKQPMALAIRYRQQDIALRLLQANPTYWRSKRQQGFLHAAIDADMPHLALALLQGLSRQQQALAANGLLLPIVQHGQSHLLAVLLDITSVKRQLTDSSDPLLVVAISSGHLDLIVPLLSAGVNPNQVNNHMTTPLLAAAKSADVLSVAQLVAAGAEVNHANSQGNTAMMLAAREGRSDIVAELLKHSVDLEQRNQQSHTALMLAVMADKAQVVKLLLDAGANSSRRTSKGETIEVLAERHKAVRVQQLLKKTEKGLLSW